MTIHILHISVEPASKTAFHILLRLWKPVIYGRIILFIVLISSRLRIGKHKVVPQIKA